MKTGNGNRTGRTEKTGSGNRERRQERIRELTQSGAYEMGGRTVSKEWQARPKEGPHGTRIYGPPAEILDDRGVLQDGTWLEAWPQPAEKDPEQEWKNSPNPWHRLEEASSIRPGRSRVGGFREADDQRFAGAGGGRVPGQFRRDMQRRILLSAVLFGAVWGMFHMDGSVARQGQAFVKQALTEPMDFTALAGWYESSFAGAPSFIPGFGSTGEPQTASVGGTVKPVVLSPLEGGSIVSSFAELLGGVELAGQPGEIVRAAEEGRVQVVSTDDLKGPTIVVQHAGGRTTYYGQLGEASVQPNDWVKAGQAIGKLGQASQGSSSALLYFAVKEKDRYVDPAEVVPLD